ncbi:conserved hypothetical protein [Dehalogenimonas lykanthroporepellens BL-DC-9]|jgi:hypothetical protein|nr:conserved hypothetical protein [Dehalogenimonas lykanthroporepellens BL-DC-9]
MDWILIFLILDSGLAILIGIFIVRRIKQWNVAREREITALRDNAERLSGTFAPGDTAPLPPPVARYLKKSLNSDATLISTAHLTQTGRIRFNDRWINLSADQYYSVKPAGFIWNARMKLGPAWITARDCSINGRGDMLIKILSALPLFNVRGRQMDHASLMRHLSELPWLPTALLSPDIAWRAIDDRSAEATITSGEISATGTFNFNDDDEITSFTTPERYRYDTNRTEPWTGRFADYRQFGRYVIPTKAVAVWKGKDGDFEYIELTVTSTEFE